MSKGTKHDNDKAPLHMIPEEALTGMAEAFAYGASKYERFNYKKGLEITRLTDSLRRHTLAYLQGEDLDPESGLHHTKHILANAAMIEYMRINRPEMDDRYREEQKAQNEDVYIGVEGAFTVIPKSYYNTKPKESKSEYQEMAEKIYMASMSGHKIDMGNMQLAADIGEEDEEISD